MNELTNEVTEEIFMRELTNVELDEVNGGAVVCILFFAAGLYIGSQL